MKILLFSLVIGLALSAYNADAAVSYAKLWYNSYNTQYNNYNSLGGDCANFVSQCLIAGGQTLTGCDIDNKGSVSSVTGLSNCLIKKGWKSSANVPPGFKAGYPVIFPGHATIASSVNGKTVLVACHSKPHYDSPVDWYGTPTYYYL